MATLAISLLLLLVPAILSTLLLIAALSSDTPPPGIGNKTALITLLGIPATLLVTGCFLLSKVRAGITAPTRKRLFAFYTLLLAYCGFWLVAPISKEGTSIPIFDLPAVLSITLIIAIPSFLTIFTKPDPQTPSPKE